MNHLEAHLSTNFLHRSDIAFPRSGAGFRGHTSLIMCGGRGVQFAGQTRDDAAGEVFDKVARVLGLGYPGGPAIDALAAGGEPAAIAFPRAYLGEDSRFDFSFSGLKSAVINYVHHQRQKKEPPNLPDLAASFKAAVVEVLVENNTGCPRKRSPP